MPKTKVKVRNPVVRAAASLMAKGGAHTRSPSSNRRQMQQALNDEVQDYLDEREFERSRNSRGQTVAPGDLLFEITEIVRQSCPASFIALDPPGTQVFKNLNVRGLRKLSKKQYSTREPLTIFRPRCDKSVMWNHGYRAQFN